MPDARNAFVVLGAHRSGTSAMARVLNLAGLGAMPADLVPPHPVDNPTGFWEARPIIELNDAILADNGGRWDRPPASRTIGPTHIERAVALLEHQYRDADTVVLKDPRVSLLIPVWQEALVRLGFRPTYVIMLRHPAEVAASLRARDGLGWQEAVAVWAAYTSAAETDTRLSRRIFVAYDDLLADWRAVLRRIAPEIDHTGAHAGAIDAFLSPDAKRRRWEDLPAGVEGEEAGRVYETLLARAVDDVEDSERDGGRMEARPSDGGDRAGDSAWLLVTGAPRSGRSLLRAILAEHPQVGLLQEYGLATLTRRIDALVDHPPPAAVDWASPGDPVDARFNAASRFYRDQGDRGAVTRAGGTLAPMHFGAVAAGLFGGLFPGKDLRIVGDTMPIGAAWEDLPLLFDRLPGFRVIVVIRNPVDVVRSSLVRRAATQRKRDTWPVRTVEQAVAQWIAAWRTVRALQLRYGPAVKIVKYENLCGRPQDSGAEIAAWLGVAPHRAATPISALPPDLALHSAAEQGLVERCLAPIIQAWPITDAETLVSSYAAPAPPYVLGEPLHLSHEEATPFLRSGFSFREEWGRWTDGPYAVLAIPHGLARGLLLVEIAVMQAFVRDDGGVCDVVVRSGSGEPKLFPLGPGRSRIAFAVRAEETEEQGMLPVELNIARPKRADEPPTDSRALGILVEAITISALAGPGADGAAS